MQADLDGPGNTDAQRAPTAALGVQGNEGTYLS